LAAKQATSTIPIVFAAAADPVGTGLVTNLARPGGNVTGLSAQHTELAGKRLALLREIVPSLRRLAVMANVDNPASERELGEVQAVAGTLGLEVARLEIRRGRTLRAPSRSLRAAPKHFTSVPTRSYLPTGFVSTPWHSPRDCRRCSVIERTSQPEAWHTMEQIFPTCSAAPVTMSTRFCVARSRATSRSSSRPGSISS